MILRGIDFGPVCTASGVRNFFKEDGWWYHRLWRWLGLDFRGTTFIAKTTTLRERLGNMPLGADCVTPLEWKPQCIDVRWWNGVVLNAVGLSGPGSAWLLKRQRWQAYTEPFFLSFMAVGETTATRLEEYTAFADLLRRYLPDFRAPVGLQVNFSCPNVGLHADELAREADEALAILGVLDIPLVPKFNVLVPVDIATYVSRHAACDAISVSNTIPWGQCPDLIDWERLFRTVESPLAQYGGGGLSGMPLFPIVREWIVRARGAGLTKPIAAGGGIQWPEQAEQLLGLGASAIEIGTVCLLRPWRVPTMIQRVHDVLGRDSAADPHQTNTRVVFPQEVVHEDQTPTTR